MTATAPQSPKSATPDALKGSAAKANESAKSEDVKPSKEELKALYDNLPGEFRKTLDKLNASIREHNAKIETIKATESKDPKLIKAEIFENNPRNNEKLARLRKEELKLIEQIEKIRKQAYEIIDTDGLMPKELSEDEIKKLNEEVTQSTKDIREQTQAFVKLEEMMPTFKITPLIEEVKSRRGRTASTTASTSSGIKRPRFKRITVNGVTEDNAGNTVGGMVDGEERFTFTFAANYLKKQHKGFSISSNDLVEAYFKDVSDPDNLPDEHEFTMNYTYKDQNGNENTIPYRIKCYR